MLCLQTVERRHSSANPTASGGVAKTTRGASYTSVFVFIVQRGCCTGSSEKSGGRSYDRSRVPENSIDMMPFNCIGRKANSRIEKDPNPVLGFLHLAKRNRKERRRKCRRRLSQFRPEAISVNQSTYRSRSLKHHGYLQSLQTRHFG